MSIWAIADLHLSFSVDKPMNIFGENWEGYEERIKQDWLGKVKPEDTVVDLSKIFLVLKYYLKAIMIIGGKQLNLWTNS